MPREMERGTNKEWRDRVWVLRISDVDRMWEDAILQLTKPLGGTANRAGFQAMWTYLHGMLVRFLRPPRWRDCAPSQASMLRLSRR